MGERPIRFWGSALAVSLILAGGLAGGAALLLRVRPRGGIWLLTQGELWLLAVFSAGVLAILFGLSVGVGGWFRGRVGTPPREPEGSGGIDPAWWTVAVGGGLLVVYLVGWWAFGL